MLDTDRTLQSTPEVQALANQIRLEVLLRLRPEAARTLQSEEPLRAFRRELVAELYDQITVPGGPSFSSALRPARLPTPAPSPQLWPFQALGLFLCAALGYALAWFTR